MSKIVRQSACLSSRHDIMTYSIMLSLLLQGLLLGELYGQTPDKVQAQQVLNGQAANQQNTRTAESKSPKKAEQEKLEIARREYKLGLVDFKQERYREALKRFIRVYRLQSHPNLIYNMARSFEELKEYQNAAEYYRKYLIIEPNSRDRAQVEITIDTMEKLAQKSQADQEQFLTKRVAWSGVAMGSIMVIGGAMFGVQALNRSETLGNYQAGDSLQDFNRTYQERDQAALLSDLFMLSGVAIGSVGLYFALKSQPHQNTTRQNTPSQSASSKTSTDQASISLSFTGSGFSIQGAF